MELLGLLAARVKMKTVKWLIESFERDNSFEELSAEVIRQGMECEVIKYDEAGNKFGSDKVFPGVNQCVVFQGSINMAMKIQREKPWIPGAFVTWNNYLCQTYYLHYGKWLLNGDYTMMPFVEFLRRKQKLIDKFQGEFFMRPNGGTKSFTGFTWATLSKNMERLIESETAPEELVLISPIKLIDREWRLICTKDKVLTGSRYKTAGRPDYNAEVPPEVIAKGEEILRESKWVPDPIFVMDICSNYTGEYYLLEIGAFSISGLYKCDMLPIVEAASELAWLEYKEVTPS